MVIASSVVADHLIIVRRLLIFSVPKAKLQDPKSVLFLFGQKPSFAR
jgi:hypothetical protein